jgi:Fe-S cluster assembly protein SufD
MGSGSSQRMSVNSIQPEALSRVVDSLCDKTPSELRQRAMQQFIKRGFPTTRDEDWKYSDLSNIVDISERWLAHAAEAPIETLDETQIREIQSSIDATWLVFANGHLHEELSSALTESAITVTGIDDATDISIDEPLADLNAALMTDGIVIRIGKNTQIKKPVGLLFADRASSQAIASHARVVVSLASGSSARFIEYHVSSGDANHYSNVVVDVTLGDGAELDYVRIQKRSRNHSQTQRLSVRLGKDSSIRHFGMDLGGVFTRNDLNIDIAAAGVSAEFNGLYIGSDKQHIDNHTRVDHRVGPATSVQEYRGIMSGRSRCIWNGKAIVHKGADGSDATQANHNLLLSQHSEINAKPELEIYADEVKCAHGTTVGQLDDDALFYLRTRGLDPREATRVLTRAFAATVVEKSPIAELRELIASQVEARLGELDDGDGA